MIEPIRLQLSRKKGFRLQEHSLAVNGLPAVNVARPNRWGNPFVVRHEVLDGPNDADEVGTNHEAVCCFRDMLSNPVLAADYDYPIAEISTLHGKNLACWCALDAPCHADVLLEMANVDAYLAKEVV